MAGTSFFEIEILDGLAKGRKCILSVIPAKAGIQCSQVLKNSWTPFFNGVTTSYEIINFLVRLFSKRSFQYNPN
jgi:hypothetical protein